MEVDCQEILEKNQKKVYRRQEIRKRWRQNNADKVLATAEKWRKNNPDYYKEYYRQYKKDNPDKIKQIKHRYFSKNKEKVYASMKRTEAKRPEHYHNMALLAGRKWRKDNPERTHEISQRSCMKRRKDPQVKLHSRITTGVWRSLHGNKQGYSWESLVGYTCLDLRHHLEKQFLSGMSWDNIGEWHVDHKVPVSLFKFNDFNDPDFKKCWALNNLQPLWKLDNLKKSNHLL